MKAPSIAAIRATAHRLYHTEGEIEVDPKAMISRPAPVDNETGCYVQAWVWVHYADVQPSDEPAAKRRTR